MGNRTVKLAVLAIMVFVSIGAGQALAAVVLEFDPPRARPGSVVEVTLLGMNDADVFLVSMLISRPLNPAELHPEDPGMVFVGSLAAGGDGSIRADIDVPNVRPGRYVALAWCEQCADGSGTMVAGGQFVVYPSPRWLVGILFVMVAAASAWMYASRRSASDDRDEYDGGGSGFAATSL
jgi:hypothetical protein